MFGEVRPGLEDLLIEKYERMESIFSLDHQQRSEHGLLQSVPNFAHIGESLRSRPFTPGLVRLQCHETILSPRHGAQNGDELSPHHGR